MADANVVVLQGWHGENQYDEARVASGQSIVPGDLMQINTDGTARTHAAAGKGAELFFAIEEHFLPNTTIDTPYPAGSLVRFHKAQRNDRINARLAANVTTTLRSPLASNGDGTLRLAALGEFCVGYADEVVTGAVGVVKRVTLVVAPHTRTAS